MPDFIKAEIAKPNPKSTINSYRSFGYNLPTAIADILDNSISANANVIKLEYKWDGQNSYILISDNGIGMNKDELVLAMTPGSKDPEEERSEKDLGILKWNTKGSQIQSRLLSIIYFLYFLSLK